jgi:CheY-like chemotaxis protein
MKDSTRGRDTILIVDDMPANIKILGQLLRVQYDVRIATGGEKALAVAGSDSPPDLVLLDIMMPGMDGYEVCRRLKTDSRLKDIPVIFITAKGEVEDETKGFEIGAVDYIIKPFSPSIVMARVRTHLALKRQRDKLAKMARDLTELNHMKDNLLAVCSHDLRSPLNGILGFADLLLEKAYLEPEDRDGLAHIKASGNVLLGLVNDILDLSKARAEQVDLKKEPLLLSEVVETSIRSLKHLAIRKKQTLAYEDQSEGCRILGNASALGRVFNNLLSNAIKFTPEEGTVRVAIETAHKGGIRAKITDTGIGIPQDRIPYLFDQFTRTSQMGTGGEPGTGLGMSIVKEILEKHEAPIEVESEPGRGSCFTLTFPSCEQVSVENSKPVQAAPRSEPIRILLAEDNPVNRKLGEKMLGKQGHEVVVAEDGEEAVSLFTDSSQNFDLILMDIQMPRMDGFQGTRAIRAFESARFPEVGAGDPPAPGRRIPIVAMTGHARAEDREKCLAAGMDDFMTKPINKDQVIEMVRKWVPGPRITG